MKTKILIIALLAFGIGLQAHAAVSVEHTLSQEYLQNNGYSKQVYDSVSVSRARALGEEYYSSEELRLKKSKAPVRWWRKFQMYLDPAIDDYSFYHHDIKPGPSTTDL